MKHLILAGALALGIVAPVHATSLSTHDYMMVTVYCMDLVKASGKMQNARQTKGFTKSNARDVVRSSVRVTTNRKQGDEADAYAMVDLIFDMPEYRKKTYVELIVRKWCHIRRGDLNYSSKLDFEALVLKAEKEAGY